ncbi:hypothetical protein [Nocardia xishanensis]
MIGPDASGRAVDQHMMTYPDARDVAKKVARQGIRASIGAKRFLFQRHGGFGCRDFVEDVL